MSLTALTFTSSNCFLQNNNIKIKFNSAKDKTNITSKIKYQFRLLYTPILVQITNSSTYAQYESDELKWIYLNWQNADTFFSQNILTLESTIPYFDYDVLIKYEIRAIDDIQNSYSEGVKSNSIVAFFNGSNIFSIGSISLIQSEIQKISCRLNISKYGLIYPYNFNEINKNDSTSLNQIKKYLSAAESSLNSTQYNFTYFISQTQEDRGEEKALNNTFSLSNRPADGIYDIEIQLTNNINIELAYYVWVKITISNNNNYILIANKETISNFKLLQPESDPLTIKKNGIQCNVNRKNTYQIGAGVFSHTNGVADKNGNSDNADSIALMDTHTVSNSSLPINEPSIGFYDNNFNREQAIISRTIQDKKIFYFDTPNVSGFGLTQENNILYHTKESSAETTNKSTLTNTINMVQQNDLPKNIFNKYCYSKNSNESLYLSLLNGIGLNYLIAVYVYPSVDGEFSLELDRAIYLDVKGKKRYVYKNVWNLCCWMVRIDTPDIMFSFSSTNSGTYLASHFLAYDISSVYSKDNYSLVGSIKESQLTYATNSFETQIQNEESSLFLKDFILKAISDEDMTVPKDHSSSEKIYGIASEDKYGHIKLYNNIAIEIDDENAALTVLENRKQLDLKANLNHANKDISIIGSAAQDKYGHIGIIDRNASYLTSTCNESQPKVPKYIYYGQNDIPAEGVNLNSTDYCFQSGTYSFVGGSYTKTNFPEDFFNSSSFSYGYILETKLGYNYYGSQFLYQTATNKIWYRSIKGSSFFSPWMRIVTAEIVGNNSIENAEAIAKINPSSNEIPYTEDGDWVLVTGNNKINCKYHRIGKICQVFGWGYLTETLSSSSIFSGFPFTAYDTYDFINISFQGGNTPAPNWSNKGEIKLNLSGKLAYSSTDSNGLTITGNAYEWGRVNTLLRISGSYMIKY